MGNPYSNRVQDYSRAASLPHPVLPCHLRGQRPQSSYWRVGLPENQVKMLLTWNFQLGVGAPPGAGGGGGGGGLGGGGGGGGGGLEYCLEQAADKSDKGFVGLEF